MDLRFSDQRRGQDMDMHPNVATRRETDERPGTAKMQISEAPTLIRQFPQEPRYLDMNYDRTGGSEAAAWRHKFVKVIESHTSKMTIDERTEFFEACIARNKDRYIQTFAAYYGQHPEHIPDRPGGAKSTKQEQEGMLENAEIEARQDRLFKAAWTAVDSEVSPFNQRRSLSPDSTAGPKDEASPYAERPTCKHCVLEARKEKWRSPFAALGRAFKTKGEAKPKVIPSHTPQQNGAKTTACTSFPSTAAGSSSRSILKCPPSPCGMAHAITPPTEPAQHGEQQA